MLEIWRQAAAGDGSVGFSILADRWRGQLVDTGGASAELARYEAELNRHISQDMAVLCLYDLSRFSPEAVINAVMTHPVVVVGDRVVDNPSAMATRRRCTTRQGQRRDRGRPTPQDISDLVNSGHRPTS